MSDGISTPPESVRSDTTATARTEPVSRREGGDASPQDSQAGSNQSQASSSEPTVAVRDPAVSIAASVADLQPGDRLVETITRLDGEGRPILDTPRATYALQPSAGLEPGDGVQLIVRTTGHDLTADLVRRNTATIDPPVRLNLTVIALHVDSQGGGATSGANPQADFQPYRAPSGLPQSEGALTATRAATLTLPAAGEARPILQTDARETAAGAAASVNTGAAQTVQLVPFQAVNAAGQAVALNPVSQELLPLLRLDGAEVSRITPLSVDEVRALALPVQSFSNSTSPIARLETRQDGQPGPTLFAPLQSATNLIGRAIFLQAAPNSDVAPSERTLAPAAFSVPGQISLTEPSSGLDRFQATLAPSQAPEDSRSVSVGFIPKTAESAPAGSLLIREAVILRTALGTTGPQMDLRLVTDIGTLSVTVPAQQRPVAGDAVHITPIGDKASLETTERAAEVRTVPTGAATTVQVETLSALSENAAAQQQIAAAAGGLTAPSSSRQADAQALSSGAAEADQVVQALVQSGDPAAIDALAARSADGGGKLTNSLLFFLTALGKSGTPVNPAAAGQAWLGGAGGATVGALTPDGAAQLDRLAQQLVATAALTTDAAPGDWRVLQLPFEARDGIASLFSFLVRDEVRDREAGGQGPGDFELTAHRQRFIVQVTFSVIGDIQLDGMIEDRQFDLTLRSQRTLPTGLSDELTALFADALDANAYTGALRIREETAFLVDVDAILAQHRANAIVRD